MHGFDFISRSALSFSFEGVFMDLVDILTLSVVGILIYYLSGSQTLANILAPTGPTGDGTTAYSGGPMNATQLLQVASAAGFAGADLVTAVAIALAESGGNPHAYGDIGPQCCSYGLWQINSYWHPEFGPDFSMLYDPGTNAAAAYSIYVRAGNSFSPWSTFGSGKYLAYVSTVQAVA